MSEKVTTKNYLHPRSYHRSNYNYEQLIKSYPQLKDHVLTTKNNLSSINYADSAAVKALNKAILISDYGLEYWDIPEDYLCPAVPGRAEYLHHIADLLGSFNNRYPMGPHIKCMDIGIGANCIYPIIGRKVYKWSFIGTDINKQSLKAAKAIIQKNSLLKDHVELRHQTSPDLLMTNLIKQDEYIDLMICNPPFYESAKAAKQASLKKSAGLKSINTTSVNKARNFRGQSNELWCNGGELSFVRKMIHESKVIGTSCFMYSSLISKSKHLEKLQIELDKLQVSYTTTIQLSLGNKKSHILAWSFLKPKQMKIWAQSRWG